MKSCVWAAMHPRIIDNAVVQWRQGLRACLQAENTSRKQEEDILNIFFNSIYHINLIARKCYYQLRQLPVVSRSLTHQSRLTRVHAFVTNRIDCCCSLLVGLPLGTLARLDRVLRSAARLVGGCPSFLPSLPTCVVYCIGCLYLSGYRIVSLQWTPVVSLAAPPLTSATSAAQCRFWPHVGCCVLLRGVSFWSLGEGPFRLWVHQHGMISPLSCVP